MLAFNNCIYRMSTNPTMAFTINTYGSQSDNSSSGTSNATAAASSIGIGGRHLLSTAGTLGGGTGGGSSGGGSDSVYQGTSDFLGYTIVPSQYDYNLYDVS